MLTKPPIVSRRAMLRLASSTVALGAMARPALGGSRPKKSRPAPVTSPTPNPTASASPVPTPAPVDAPSSPASPTPSPSTTAIEVPPAALGAGFSRLTFADDFASMGTIDRYASGNDGYLWYADRPWKTGHVTNPQMMSVADSVLTLNEDQTDMTWGISTISPRTGKGRSFRHGYFEARMWFDPALAPKSPGFPAFWSLPVNQIVGTPAPHHAEIDFFEAYKDPFGAYVGHHTGTVHEVVHPDGTWINQQNANNVSRGTPLATAGWHTYGCLWQPGHLAWYLDGQLMHEVFYGSSVAPSCDVFNTTAGTYTRPVGVFALADAVDAPVAVILNTGKDWPMKVDWVRVWN